MRKTRLPCGGAPLLDPLFVEGLLLAHWPGNVRELDLLVRRLALAYGELPEWDQSILPSELIVPSSSQLQAAKSTAWTTALGAGRILEDQVRRTRELQLLRGALVATAGNVSAAAARVGISRQRAYRLLAKEAPEVVASSIVSRPCDAEPNLNGAAQRSTLAQAA